MDVATIANKVKRTVGDEGGIMIKDADIWGWIDEAQMEILRVTGAITTEATIAANTFPWNIPATWLKTKRVTYANRPLRLITLDELDALNINAADGKDTPTMYYHTASTIRLYPEPLVGDTTSVVIFYSGTAATIVSAAVPLSVPVSNHVDVIEFCLKRAYEKTGKEGPARYAHEAFEGRLSQRAFDTFGQDDNYPVIRDDPRDW